MSFTHEFEFRGRKMVVTHHGGQRWTVGAVDGGQTRAVRVRAAGGGRPVAPTMTPERFRELCRAELLGIGEVAQLVRTWKRNVRDYANGTRPIPRKIRTAFEARCDPDAPIAAPECSAKAFERRVRFLNKNQWDTAHAVGATEIELLAYMRGTLPIPPNVWARAVAASEARWATRWEKESTCVGSGVTLLR